MDGRTRRSVRRPLVVPSSPRADTHATFANSSARFPWLGQKVNNTVQFKVGASATFVGLVHPANTYAFYNSGFSNDPSVDKKGIARASVRALQADGLELTTPDPRSSVRPRTR